MTVCSDALHTVAVGLLVIGGVVLLGAVIGWIGTRTGNRLLLLTVSGPLIPTPRPFPI